MGDCPCRGPGHTGRGPVDDQPGCADGGRNDRSGGDRKCDGGRRHRTGGPAQAATRPFQYDAPTQGIGEPIPGGWSTQEQFTETGREAASFHNNWLLFLCAAISIFVLGLLVYVMFRYRRGANPTPSRTSHNTAIEVIWTVVPVLILVAIAIPSIRLMRAQLPSRRPT